MPDMTQHCARCKREAPEQESDEFLTWEVIDEVGDVVVCEGCLTLAEENSIYSDGLATAVEAGAMTAKEAIDQYAADMASEDAARRAQGLYLGDQ